MKTEASSSGRIHHGRNIRRFREMIGLKQEALAYALGGEWSQKRVSTLEQKEQIEQDILDQVAAALKVPAEAIKNFDEEKAINIISNNSYHDNSATIQYNFNPIDKWLAALEENKALYERLLQSEREKVEILKGVIEGK